MRFAALLAAALVVTSGCASTRTQRTAMIATGTIVTAIGVGLLVSMQQDDEPLIGDDGPTEGDLGCIIGGCVIAGTLTAAGLGLFVGGVASSPRDDEPDPTPPIAAATNTPAPTPAAAAPGLALSPAASPDVVTVLPLPAIETDAMTLRHARAVGLAIEQQQCSLARIMLREIARRDARYYQALVASPSVALCQ